MKRYEKLHNTFEPISTLAMMNDKFYDEVLSYLSELSVKSQSIMEDEHGLMSQCLTNMGKVYGRRIPKPVVVTEGQDLEVVHTNNDMDPVTDPIDKRGKGRGPTKRKGYANDHDRPSKRVKQSTNAFDVPHGFQIYPSMQGQSMPFQPSTSNIFRR
uniref:Uncharacterized protein n=1 Tax=Chenopodium quinoa TaxID=63459 RepID=A0A803MQP4_CHEQI